MELVDQHTKSIMEGCKERARSAGLTFENETLEYIVTNRDLLELSPKLMIPALYDYWVHDLEVLKERGRYELYPNNPYETVINTRPAVSFYNDNNPDWLNVMIFYHVLGHIDFFQNNLYFRNTWDFDFAGQALSDKRLIARLRSEKGRWVDYVIEFARGIDNIVGYHSALTELNAVPESKTSPALDFYFDRFLQGQQNVAVSEYVNEINRYNECVERDGPKAEKTFFLEVNRKHPEFDAVYKKAIDKKKPVSVDLLQFLMDHSPVLKKDENQWMTQVMEIVRNTSLFFQPQIRTKIMNEGWASYWHERLFLCDDRIRGHEVDFARVNAHVTALPRVGLNPYALGMRLFSYIEELGNKGKYSFDYKLLRDIALREDYDRDVGSGEDLIFRVRENFADFTFINTFVDQDFIAANDLFVAGRRLDQQRMVWQYYVKSKKARDYRAMLQQNLYHPPFIEVDHVRSADRTLYLIHRFEEKPLVKDYIANTMMGIEYLWGGPVKLETSEVASVVTPKKKNGQAPEKPPEVKWRRVLYTMDKRKLTKRNL